MQASLSKRLKWRAESAIYGLVGGVLKQLPIRTVFAFGEFVGRMIWPLMKSRQNTIVRNLRIACGENSEGIRNLAKASFIRTTANLVVSSISAKATGSAFAEVLTVENPELLEEAVSKGRGTVLLLAHMGNWELLTRLHRTFPEGTKSGAFYRPLNNPVMNAKVLKEREADGTRLFSKRDSLHHVSGFLRENGVIGILADQRVGMQGEVVPFFGRLTRASPLPSLLVRRCKSEVLSLSLKTVAPGKWSVQYHCVEKPYVSENCMEALERAMKVSILDVFWLQERWKMYIGPVFTPRKWLGKTDVRSAKGHRALIWQTASESDKFLPEAWHHEDISYELACGEAAISLDEIDSREILPLDYIVAFSPDNDLRGEAKTLGIPLIELS